MSDPFGDTIKAQRLQSHLTQKELAQLCGVSPTYISKIEGGGILPSDSLIRCMAGIFGVDEEWLLDTAAKIDGQALQRIASDDVRMGRLLRHIQRRRITSHQWQQIWQVLDDVPDWL
jgi:transcriptional regulator with XRE-family HTH domain